MSRAAYRQRRWNTLTERVMLSVDDEWLGLGLKCPIYVFLAAELLCLYLCYDYSPVTHLERGQISYPIIYFFLQKVLFDCKDAHFSSKMLFRGRCRSSVARITFWLCCIRKQPKKMLMKEMKGWILWPSFLSIAMWLGSERGQNSFRGRKREINKCWSHPFIIVRKNVVSGECEEE